MPQIAFYDADGNQIPDADVPAAIAEGRAFADANAELTLRRGSDIVRVGATDAGRFLSEGYSFMRADEVQHAEDYTEATSTTGQLKTAGEGLLRGATFGLGNRALEETLGEDYARQADVREQANRGLSLATELTGAIAPALLTGGSSAAAGGAARGAGLAGKLAGLTPAGALARASVGAGEAVAGRAAAAGLGARAAQAVGVGAGGAIEGAGAQLLSNTAALRLDDDELVTEQLLAGVPESALLGGALGASLGAVLPTGARRKPSTAGHVAPELAEAADVTAAAATDPGFLQRTMAKAVSGVSSKITGKSRGTIEKVLSDADIGARLIQKDRIIPAIATRIEGDIAAVDNLRKLTKNMTQRSSVAESVRSAIPAEAAPVARQQAQAVVDFTAPLRQAELSALDRAALGADNAKALKQAAEAAESRLRAAVNGGDAADIRVAIEDVRADYARVGRRVETRATREGLTREQADRLPVFRDGIDRSVAHLDNLLSDVSVWGDAAATTQRRAGLVDAVRESRGDYHRLMRNPQQFYRGLQEGDGQLERVVAHLDREAALADDMLGSGRATAAEQQSLTESRAAIDRLRAELQLQGSKMREVNTLESLIRSESDDTTGLVSAGLGYALGAAGLSTGGVGLGVAAKLAHGVVTRPGSFARQLGAIKLLKDRARTVEDTIERTVKRQVQSGSETATTLRREAPLRKRGSPAKALPASLAVMGRTAQERRVAYAKRLEQIDRLRADPIAVAELSGHTIARGLHDVAPGVAMFVAERQQRALQFLGSKMPPTPNSNPLQPHLNKRVVTDREVERMSRYIAAIERPLSVLEDWERGTLHPESVEALRAVYPRMYEQIRTRVTQRLAETTKPLPYNEQVQLGLLLDLPGNHMLTPGFLRRNQARLRGGAGQGGPPGQPRGRPPSPMSPTQVQASIEQTMTTSEQLETRL